MTKKWKDTSTIAEIIAVKYRSVVFYLAVLIGLLGASLTTFAINFLHRRVFDQIYSWVLMNKGRIEEAVFLKNFRSISLRMNQIAGLSDSFTHYEITLYDLERKRLEGTLDLPDTETEGFRSELGHLAVAYVGELTFAGSPVGFMYVRGEIKRQFLFFSLIVILGACSLLFWIVRRQISSFLSLLSERILTPTVRLTEMMQRLEVQAPVKDSSGHDPALEVHQLYQGYAHMVSRLKDYAEVERKRAEADTGLRVATQVAHDIRSPLAALKAASESISKLPEEERNLVRLSIQRIEEIASNLIDTHRKRKAGDNVVSNLPKSEELILSHVETILAEKRAQFATQKDISLELKVAEGSYPLFAFIHGAEFKRALSNVLNNSFEAMEQGKRGTISVELRRSGDRAEICVTDSGKGIPVEILPRLMQRGFSYGKPAGSGLGLFHTKEVFEQWKGTLEITSAPGKGCRVLLSLPLADSPRWFLPVIALSGKSQVVIVDDDMSIHQLWETRFRKLPTVRVDLIHLYSPDELGVWLTQQTDSSGAFFLIDYEYQGKTLNGLQVIQAHQLQAKAALVTARSDEPIVRQACLDLSIRLIPKSVAAYVPITS